MTTIFPQAQLILDYKIYFEIEPPENRISLINHISKKHILYEICALNYRLKPKNEFYINESLENQVKELKYFAETEEIFMKYFRVIKKFTTTKQHYPIFFNRQACLFAIEEIINSDEIQDIENFSMSNSNVWESIIKYFLAVNYTITQIKKEENENGVSFETLNAKLLPLNEPMIKTDQLFVPYRGHQLIDYFLNTPEFSNEIKNYFQEFYEIEPKHFISNLISMYMGNSHENPERDFYYSVPEEKQDFFDRLSKRVVNKETYKLISIRKSPFINMGEHEYLLSDNSFLIEKTYSQFINDFWFDWVKDIKDEKGKQKFTISFYRSTFGYFFEKYISEILKNSFENCKYSKLLMFDDLKITTSKRQIEIADIYFRYNNKIFLGQAKSGSIYDVEKFGGSVEILYKNNRDVFFENFGVNQIIESLSTMDEYIKNLDYKFPKGHSYQVYPCIIVNDKSFQTPLMAEIFNVRFQELLKDFNIKKVKVNPLTLIHINDLERLEDSLNKNPKEIWKFLEYNHKNKKFVTPFYDTIDSKWEGRKYPTRILELLKSLIYKYNGY